MVERRVKRKDLWEKLDKIKQDDWINAGISLGLIVYQGAKGTHWIIRDPKYPDKSDTRGLIATVPKKLFKQSNQHTFKHLLDFHIDENDIWKALRM